MARKSGIKAKIGGLWVVNAGAAFLCVLGALSGAQAQSSTPLSSSYITPFPQTDRYQLRVLGDWLGTGLTAGLDEAFKNEGTLQIADASRSNYGLLRAEQVDLYGEADRMLAATPPVNIAVIILGINDRGSLRIGAGRAQPGSEEWKDTYSKEAEKLIKKLRGANVAVYWVGLPAMGNPAMNEFVASVNDAVRQAVYLNGAKFIETSGGFTDQLGAYSAYGPDITGQTKRLREGDGIALTAAGNRKLANYVEIAIRRDLAQARAQRNIPLAGDEEEQARVVPPRPGALPKAPPPDTALLKPASPKSDGGSPFKTELAPSPSPAQEAARRDQAAFAVGGGPQGEYILSDLGNGLTSIAVISPVSDLSIREIQRQTPLADRLYFKVLSKGEALPAKEGRADDFAWHGQGVSPSQ
jgi:uncharacterized protein